MKKVREMKSYGGFTLMELMIVIIIVAVLSAVALPAYQSQVLKTKRNLGRAELVDIMSRQEQYFVNNRQYAPSLASLGYADPYAIDQDSNVVAAGSPDRIYLFQLSTVSTTYYELQAIPQLVQLKDKQCGTLGITSTGVKTETGSLSVEECW